MGISLFIAEPTGTCRLSLRRFRHADDGGHFHDASVVIDEDAQCVPRSAPGGKPSADDRIGHDDPRWPGACSCGEPFRDGDRWQVNEIDWYEGTGGRFAWGSGAWDGIPGAMIRAPWRDSEGRPPAWTVFLPNGAYWNTNDPSSGEGNKLGPLWEVTGNAPLITVSPSIDDRDPSRPWHGWIRNGILEPA
jgi:hypothetical protein